MILKQNIADQNLTPDSESVTQVKPVDKNMQELPAETTLHTSFSQHGSKTGSSFYESLTWTGLMRCL